MNPTRDRAFADTTDDELAAQMAWLGRHLEALQNQHAAMAEELRRRQGDGAARDVGYDDSSPAGGGMLQYAREGALRPEPLMTGDSYADEARAYALRVVGALCGLGFLAALAALLMMTLR